MIFFALFMLICTIAGLVRGVPFREWRAAVCHDTLQGIYNRTGIPLNLTEKIYLPSPKGEAAFRTGFMFLYIMGIYAVWFVYIIMAYAYIPLASIAYFVYAAAILVWGFARSTRNYKKSILDLKAEADRLEHRWTLRFVIGKLIAAAFSSYLIYVLLTN